MNKCGICPRKCSIDRKKQIGFCGAKKLKIAKVMRHFWEEPSISGKRGSGAIFFSHCSLKCCFCQNFEISHIGLGKEISIKQLVEIFKLLEESGVENINLVSPTHYLNEIVEALKIFKPRIPIIWNTNGFELASTIKKLEKFVDIFLCDFKFFDNSIAKKYSSCENYFENCSKALIQMRKNQPKDIFENGIMKKGLIVRHLVLPSHAKDSENILIWIKNNLGVETCVSLMSQYTPCFKAERFAEIKNKLKPIEYKFVLKKLHELGFENGFVQELKSSSDEFIPNFDTKLFLEL